MKKLHNKLITDPKIEPNEGQRDLLCSNKKSERCPSLGSFNPNDVPEDVALNHLAKILSDIYLGLKSNERKNR